MLSVPCTEATVFTMRSNVKERMSMECLNNWMSRCQFCYPCIHTWNQTSSENRYSRWAPSIESLTLLAQGINCKHYAMEGTDNRTAE